MDTFEHNMFGSFEVEKKIIDIIVWLGVTCQDNLKPIFLKNDVK